MKEETTITLESKDLRFIVARALRIPDEQVTQLRYGIGIKNLSMAEVGKRIAALDGRTAEP